MRFLWLVIFLVGCTSSAENETLKQAAKLHNEAMEVGHKTSLQVSQLKQMEARLSTAHQDSLQAIMSTLGEWYDTVVEVPGYEHDHSGHDHSEHDHHDHSGHDHHDHGEELNYLEGLSPEDILEIQQALKWEIEQIARRVNTLTRDIQNQSSEEQKETL